MTPGRNLLATLEEIAHLADTLPDGAGITVEWNDAPPDLLLALAQQEGATLRSVDGGDEAEWARDGMTVRARRQSEQPTMRPAAKLILVKP